MSLGSAPTHGQPAPVSPPLLSITMPTKDRPQLLSRALASVGRAVGPDADRVELTVSDGSADEASAQAVDRFLAGWAGAALLCPQSPAAAPGRQHEPGDRAG